MPYGSVAIAGMAKNAGKTTTLNYLIQGFGAQNAVRLGLTSIGLDGEEIDAVTGTPKPRIFVPRGSIIATAEKLLVQRGLCDITKEILDVTDIGTPLGRIVVMRALSAGFAQIAGPSITAQAASLVKDLRGFGADKVIVDGAVGRKSLAMPGIADAVVLATGASLSKSMDGVIAQTRHIVDIFCLPEADMSLTHIYIEGAVTDAKVADNYDCYIVADDAAKILITPATAQKVRIRGGSLAVKRRINLAAVTINPVSPYGHGFDSAEFLEKMREALPVPVFDIGGTNLCWD